MFIERVLMTGGFLLVLLAVAAVGVRADARRRGGDSTIDEWREESVRQQQEVLKRQDRLASAMERIADSLERIEAGERDRKHDAR